MDDALSRKVQEMHVVSLSIFQSDLRQQIVNYTTGDDFPSKRQIVTAKS